MIKFFAAILRPFLWLLDFLTPVGDLIARVYVAQVFLKAGWVKILSFESTKLLFQHEYNVPLLNSTFAAYLATGAELILPIMLILGFGGRITIFIFFVYNLIAAISYPYLWTTVGAVGLNQHILWGLILMLLMFHGPGKLSLDYWIRQRHGHHLERKKDLG